MPKYVAYLQSDKSRIYNSKFENWLHVDDKELWRFEVFTNEFLGG